MAQEAWLLFLSAIVLSQSFTNANIGNETLRNILYNPDIQSLYVIGSNAVYIIDNKTLSMGVNTVLNLSLTDKRQINSTVPEKNNAQFLYNDSLILLRRDDLGINYTCLSLNENSNYSQTFDSAIYSSEGLAFIVKPDAVIRYIPPYKSNFSKTEVQLLYVNKEGSTDYVYSSENLTYFKAGYGLQDDKSKGLFIATDKEGVAKYVLFDVEGNETTKYSLACGDSDKNITNGTLLHATVIEDVTRTKRGFLALFSTQDETQLLCFYGEETISKSKINDTVVADRFAIILGYFDVTSLSGVYLNSVRDLVIYIGTADGRIFWSHVLVNETTVNPGSHPLYSNKKNSIRKILVTNHSIVALTDQEVLSHKEQCKGQNWSNCSEQKGFLCGWNVNNNTCMNLPENNHDIKTWIPSQRMRIFKIEPGIRIGSRPQGKVRIMSPYFNHSNNLSCQYLNQTDEKCRYPYITSENRTEEVTVDFFLNGNQQVGQTVVYYYDCSVFGSEKECKHENCTWLSCSMQCIDKKPDPEAPNCPNDGQNSTVCQYVEHGYVWSSVDNICLETKTEDLNNNCAQPKICKVTPNTTTVDGNETITLDGEYLGHFFNESLSILLAGVECKLIQDSDKIPNQLKCQAGIARNSMSGHVNVTIGNRSSDSSLEFTYKKVVDSGLEFAMGPVAGGTKLSLKGGGLDVAEIGDVAVMINGTYNCNVTSVTPDQINCTTGPGEEGENLPMSIKYRNSVTVGLKSTFTYRPNPRIDYIEPNVTFNSGGISITLHGIEFDAIQRPEIALSSSSQFHECTGVKTNTTLVCPSPPSSSLTSSPIRRKRQAQAPERNKIQVRMDGVVLTSNLTYVTDPEFKNFTEEGQIRELGVDEELVIMGERLNAAADAKDYKITIGTEECKLFAVITETTLTCNPPPEEPTQVHSSSLAPEVEVRLGNIVQRVGYVRYVLPHQTEYIVIGVLVCFAVVILVVSVVLARYFIKKNKKKMNEKMERLELEVREQCREVFAELQTDMTDVTEELVAVGIPFQSFHIYILQFIFPTFEANHLETHIALTELQEHEGTKEDLEAAMILLDQLVNNKFFLVSVIKTLDNQNYRKLTVKDRSETAAYISLLLMNNMEYFTEVIEALLMKQGYIYKNPKEFFKRCETITEKLVLNWLAMCMYNPLKKDSGSSLYILHKAIESVSQKFAIDAVTGKARATLSPSHLLVLDFEPEVINITVQINNGRFETGCRVLDCDTITQMKTKCLNSAYKREAASERPGADDIDIEWRITPDMGKLLYDEDSSSIVSNGYRKLNTVRHYGITNGSVVCLLSKERDCVECDYVNNGSIVSLNETKILIQSEDTESKMNDSPVQLEELPTIHLEQENDGSRSMRVLPEINYQRHLQTKMSLKKFIDDMVDNTVRLDEVPYTVRYLFSQLEKIGQNEGVDNSIVESWKKQSYGIRFWTRLLSRPGILFDLNKASEKYVQPNMNIITLAYNDSYSPSQDLGRNSLTEKLLFYKDCMAYREKINKFFSSRTVSTPVAMEIFSQELEALPSTLASVVINRQSVLYQFYVTIDLFVSQIRSGLVETTETNRLQLSVKLDEVFKKLRNS